MDAPEVTSGTPPSPRPPGRPGRPARPAAGPPSSGTPPRATSSGSAGTSATASSTATGTPSSATTSTARTATDHPTGRAYRLRSSTAGGADGCTRTFPAQVAVHHGGPGPGRRAGRTEPYQRRAHRVREGGTRLLAPGDAVRHRPRVGALRQRPGVDPGERGREPLGHLRPCAPVPRRVRTGAPRRRGPPVDDDAAARRRARERDPQRAGVDVGRDVVQPPHRALVLGGRDRLEHDVARAPGGALPARQRDGGAAPPERPDDSRRGTLLALPLRRHPPIIAQVRTTTPPPPGAVRVGDGGVGARRQASVAVSMTNR